MIGKTVSHYRVLSKLGEGGMGVVYLAEDTVLGRQVAIKSLTIPSLPGQRHFRTRFLREARAASHLNHPHIATIYDYGETDDGQPYLVMELVSGQSLSELLRHESLPPDRAVGIIKQVAEAIAEAHRHGIIHRDIKPSNVAINQRNDVKVLDFGLAKTLEPDNQISSESNTQTLDGVIVGTPSYLSPEQALGTPVDKRSDIFSLGSLLYECLTGRPAFSGRTLGEICAQIILDEPTPPSQANPRIPPELDRITLKALAKKTDARYQTAEELLEDLKAVEPNLSQNVVRSNVGPATSVRVRSAIERLFAHKRARVLAVVALALLVAVPAVWFATRRMKPAGPSAEAQQSYRAGIVALRNASFVKAGKLFEQAIQQHERFPLAHARLAEVWMELDYEERATGQMLRVTELAPDVSALPEIDVLYLQAITANVRRNYQGAIENFEEIIRRLPENEKTSAYFDLGRTHERAGDTKRAIEAYEQVTQRDGQAAPAFMRLGGLYGRRQEAAKAAAALDTAYALYNAQGNVEGMAEVFYQRGAFLNVADRLPEAQEQLRRALDLSVTTDNKAQQIKTLLQLSAVSYSTGETVRAEQYVSRAMELARSEQLDNLTTHGLIDIGNAFFIRGEYAETEKHFEQALQIAKANKGRRAEARALLSLGSLSVQQANSTKALSYLEPALAFYRQGNFHRETLQALLLLGRANEQQGNNEAALESFKEQLQLAQKVNDVAQVAQTHAAMGLLLSHQERFTEALNHYNESYNLNKSLGLDPKTGYDLVNRGNLLWQLGHYTEASDAFKQASDVASRPGGVDKQLLPWIHLFRARMFLSQLRYSETVAEIRKASALADTQSKGVAVEASYTHGLAEIYSGTSRAGVVKCQQALDVAKSASVARLIPKAQLAVAEALLATGDAANALTYALQAQETFARLGSRHSEWRAWLIAAQASRRQQDEAKVDEYAARASGLLTAFEKALGTNEYNSYLSRPDIQRDRKQLVELLPGVNN